MKKNIFKTVLVAALAIVSFTSCDHVMKENKEGEGKIGSKEIKVAPFTDIMTTYNMQVKLVQSTDNTTKVTVKGYENLMKYLDIKSEKGKLTITMDDRYSYNGTEKTVVYVSTPSVRNLEVMGTGRIILDGMVKSDDLNVTISGAGDFAAVKDIECTKAKFTIMGAGSMKCHSIKCAGKTDVSISGSGEVTIGSLVTNNSAITISGSGEIKLGGHAEYAEFSISGAGDVDATNYHVKKVVASASGAGDIRCNASESFEKHADGAADVENVGKAGK